MKTIPSTFALALACGLFSTQATAQTQVTGPSGSPQTPPPPVGSEIVTLNATGRSMWVTVYAPNIIGAGCVAAGKSKSWKINPANRGAHQVRAEMTTTRDCKPLPGNKHVVCDTRMAMASHAALQLKGNPGQCWWEPAARTRM